MGGYLNYTKDYINAFQVVTRAASAASCDVNNSAQVQAVSCSGDMSRADVQQTCASATAVAQRAGDCAASTFADAVRCRKVCSWTKDDETPLETLKKELVWLHYMCIVIAVWAALRMMQSTCDACRIWNGLVEQEGLASACCSCFFDAGAEAEETMMDKKKSLERRLSGMSHTLVGEHSQSDEESDDSSKAH